MENAVKRIGVLTSGGDAPGMNACIRAVVRSALGRGIECVGIRRGWSGLINGDIMPMDSSSVSRIINRGGTMLYTARSEEFRTEAGQQRAVNTCKLLGLDGVVAIGHWMRFLAEEAPGAEHFDTVEQALPALRRAFTPGTALLVKASHAMHFEKIVEELEKV